MNTTSNSINKINKLLLLKIFIVLSMLFNVSCAASLHRGQVTVPKPLINETNETIWFNYWQDQLDGYEGNVIAPTAEYPEVAKQSYQRAKLNWDKKVRVAHTKTIMVSVLGTILGAFIISSITTSSVQ